MKQNQTSDKLSNKTRKITAKRIIIRLSGLLFAAYSAYYVFILVRDRSSLPSEGILISALVALLFAVLSAFAWTAGIKTKDVRF